MGENVFLVTCLNAALGVKKASMLGLFFILIWILVSGCTHYSSHTGGLESSTDLTAFKKNAEIQRQQGALHPSNQACSNRYKVVSGDSLSAISARCNIRLSALAKANHLQKPYVIKIGQYLVIPDGNPALSGPQSSSVAKTYRPPSKTELQKSYQKANWQWPMTQKFEHRFKRDHLGITGLEIKVLPGMAVLAVADGEVVYTGNGIMQFGLMVMLKHASGHISVYAHNSQVQVREGQKVKTGQTIALSGASGLTERPKVYIEARYKGNKVDIKQLF